MRTSFRSVSMPVSKSSISTPSLATASIMTMPSAGKHDVVRRRPDPAEQRGAEQDAGDQLAHDRRLADALEQFAKDAPTTISRSTICATNVLSVGALAAVDRSRSQGLQQRKAAALASQING